MKKAVRLSHQVIPSTQYRKCLIRADKTADSSSGRPFRESTLPLDLTVTTATTATTTNPSAAVAVGDNPSVIVEEEDGAICIDLSNFTGRIRIQEPSLLSSANTVRPDISITTTNDTNTNSSDPAAKAGSLVKELNDALFGNEWTATVPPNSLTA